MSEQWVYGWGRTKHIASMFRDSHGRPVGLCGAFGGFYRDEPQRPTCKHCTRIERSRPSTDNNLFVRSLAQIEEARRLVMAMHGGNLDHPALDHLEAASNAIVTVFNAMRAEAS